MILSDLDLHRAIARRDLGVYPYDPAHVQPASIDLHLGEQFVLYSPADEEDEHLDPDRGVLPAGVTAGVTAGGDQFLQLHAGEFALGHTAERVRLPDDLCASVEGVSSLGRVGLAVHVTAGFIDPGFDGQITLELVNHSGREMRLRPGMRIAQLCVMRMTGPASRPYGHQDLGSKYQGQRGAVPARPARSTP